MATHAMQGSAVVYSSDSKTEVCTRPDSRRYTYNIPPPPPKTTFGEPFLLGWVFEMVPEESPVRNCVGNASPERAPPKIGGHTGV